MGNIMTAQEQDKQTEDEFESFFVTREEVEKPKERSIAESIQRRGSRYLQRGAETIGGLPGDVVQLVRGLAQLAPGGITHPALGFGIFPFGPKTRPKLVATCAIKFA